MQILEAAQHWMAHLRDTHLSQFDFMLLGRYPGPERK
jgi:hypothetical protein